MKKYSENYEIIITVDNGHSIVKNDFEFYGVLNFNREIVIDFIYTNILYFDNCKYFVYNEYEWFFIDTINKSNYLLCETKINEDSILNFMNINESIIKIEIQITWEEDEEYFDTEDEEYYFNSITKQKKIYGCIDNLGNTILTVEYDYIGEFFNGFAKIQKDKNWGIINEKGKIILPVEFENLEFQDGNNIKATKIIVISEESKSRVYGFYDCSGRLVIPFLYSSIGYFKNGKANAIDLEGNKGYIDIIGNKIVEEEIILPNGLIKEKVFTKWGIRTKENYVLLSHEFNEIGDFVNGKAKVNKNGKFGYINDEFTFTIPCEFEHIDEFFAGKAKARKGRFCWGIIDEFGKTKISFGYEDIDNFVNGKTKACKNGNWGLINESEDFLIPFEYEDIDILNDNYYRVKKGHKWGCIDEKNEIIIPYLYDSIEVLNDDMLLVSRGFDYETQILDDYDQIFTKNYRYQINFGCIDYNGNVLIPLEYEELNVNSLNHIIVLKNSKWGVIDFFCGELISFDYDFIEEFENNIFVVGERYYEDKKVPLGYRLRYGCIDAEEKIIVPVEYQEIGKFNKNGVAKAKKDEKYGLIDQNGNVIAPFEYDEMKDFVDDKIIVKKDFSDEINWENLNIGWVFDNNDDYTNDDFSLWGVLDDNGNTVFPIEFDEIRILIDGEVNAIRNGKLEFIKKNLLLKSEEYLLNRLNKKECANENDISNQKSKKNETVFFKEDNNKYYKNQIQLSNKLIKSRLNDKWGITSHIGKVIIQHQYKLIGKLINGIFKVTSNGYNFGYISEKGKIIVPVEYARLGRFVNGKALACKSQYGKMKYGCINDKGKVIIPFEYEKLSYFINGKAIAQRKWDFFIIDDQNKKVIIKEKIELPFQYTTREKNFEGEIEYEKHNFSIEVNPNIEGCLEFFVIEEGERELTKRVFNHIGISLDHWGSEELEVKKNDFDDPTYFGDAEDHSFSNNGLRDSFNELTQGVLGDFEKWQKDGGDLTTLQAELGY